MAAPDFTAALSAIRSPDTLRPLTALVRLRHLLALESEDVASLVWYSCAIGVLSLAVPVATQSLVNGLAFTALTQPIVVLSLLVLLGLSLAALLRTLRMHTVEKLQQRLLVRATHDSITRVTRARLATIADHGGPELMNRFFEVVTIQKAVAKLLVDGVSVALQGAVSLLLLAFYHPALLAFDMVLIAAIFGVVLPLGRGGIESAIAESKKKYQIAAWLEEVTGGVRAFKVSEADQLAFARADALAAEYVTYRRKQFRVVLRQSIAAYTVQILATAGLLGLGGWLVIRQELTLGQLVAAELVVAGVSAGLTKLGQYAESFYDLVASIDKLGTIVDLDEEPSSGRTAPAAVSRGASLSFDSVSYSYPDGAVGISQLSLSLAAGEELAIWGNDSSGKSTLAELCLLLRVPDTGVIRIDGVDLRAVALSALRRDVALVSSRQIFDGTLLENLLMGAPEEDSDIQGALRAAALDADVAALADGMHTRLGHAGVRLTSSQASRLMLARALIRKPRLLVIDEALDRLGRETIDQVLRGLRQYATGMSLLVLTSREELSAQLQRSLQLVDARLLASQEA
jgi:ABC-type bacteriocin/lantibiotic exporter with double-glycine peptidase domain